MFCQVSNASKFAFIKFVQELQADDVQLVDCQVRTDHLISLGAGMISRVEFCSLLKKNI
jgi:leucyl/phenylalanyl-tRNA--protein transferase